MLPNTASPYLQILYFLTGLRDVLNIVTRSQVYVSPRWCLYSDVVVGLVWSNDPERYAGGNIATGRATHAGQVEGDDPGPPGWGLDERLTTSHRKKYVSVSKPGIKYRKPQQC
jgi:hypothetical protein